MVLHVCESCNYSTNKGWIYRNHLISNKHLNLQTSTQEYSHVCEYCTKKYKTTSGLWKHKNICKNKPTPQVSILLERITQLENKVLENQTGTVNNITNNITNNIIINQLNYLNTHCNNAMNIEQFVESVNFIKDDYNEIDKNRFLLPGIIKVLNKQLANLSAEKYPIHCSVVERNQPTNFYVRDNDQWTQESHSDIEYQLKYGDFDDTEEGKLGMMRFLEKFTQEFYDKYMKLSKNDPNLKRIDDKMSICGQSKTLIEMLREISEIESLVLNPPSATNTNTDPNLLAT